MSDDFVETLRNPPLPLPDLSLFQNSGTLIGIGCDIIEIARIRDVITRQGQRFLQRVFTDAERQYCESQRDPAPHYAARFAVKEAVSKAFRVGIGAEFGWQTVSVTHGPRSEPLALLDPQGQRLLTHIGATDLHITLTHSDTTALALAALTKK